MPRIPIKALGLGVGAGLGLVLSERKGQAFPVGKFVRRAAKGALSSASEVLRGLERAPGKVIKEVRKGRGDWREIAYLDGTTEVVHKDYVTSLVRASQTQRYLERFRGRGEGEQLEQALRSLKMHYGMNAVKVPRTLSRTLHKRYLRQVSEMMPKLTPETRFVYYEDRFFPMPLEYAERLEKAGIVKIMRTPRDLEVVKP